MFSDQMTFQDAREARLRASVADLLDIIALALPYVEDADLSDRMRAAVEAGHDR